MPRFLIIVMLAAALPPLSAAQMRGGAHVMAGRTGFRNFRGRTYGYPFSYSDYYGSDLEPLPPTPPLVMEKRIVEPERPAEPVMIEWQGDHFVRYGDAQKTGAQFPDYAQVPVAEADASSEVSHELPPAVLIYRDGHREEVSDYVITRGVLYAQSDYARTGTWTRNIQLSALDLTATLNANENAGARFVLPSTFDDVVTRP